APVDDEVELVAQARHRALLRHEAERAYEVRVEAQRDGHDPYFLGAAAGAGFSAAPAAGAAAAAGNCAPAPMCRTMSSWSFGYFAFILPSSSSADFDDAAATSKSVRYARVALMPLMSSLSFGSLCPATTTAGASAARSSSVLIHALRDSAFVSAV